VAENPIVQEALAAAEDYEAVYKLPSDAEFYARVDAVTEQFGNVARRIWSMAVGRKIVIWKAFIDTLSGISLLLV